MQLPSSNNTPGKLKDGPLGRLLTGFLLLRRFNRALLAISHCAARPQINPDNTRQTSCPAAIEK